MNKEQLNIQVELKDFTDELTDEALDRAGACSATSPYNACYCS